MRRSGTAVKLNGESLTTIQAAPQVRSAQYQSVYRPAGADPDLSLISAVQAWNQGGVSYSVSASSVTLKAGESATVTVTMNADKGASGGDHYATLRLSAGGAEVAPAVAYAFVK